MKLVFHYNGKVSQTEIPKPLPLNIIVNSRVNENIYDVKKSDLY